MEFIQIEVSERTDRGSAAAARMRREGRVPGVLYGLQRRNVPVTIVAADLERFLRSGSHLVELRMQDQTRPAILREVQLDPLTDAVIHVDFVRVDKDHEVETEVPVVFRGIARGTTEGGVFHAILGTLTVRARPRDLPREVVLDVTPLGVGDTLFVRDVPLPQGVTIMDAPEEAVAHVVIVREVEEPAAGEGAAAASEPELIRKGAGEEADEK
jgi:large subunit ribosomal protein L25